LVRNFISEWQAARAADDGATRHTLPRLVFITGTLFAPVLESLLREIDSQGEKLTVLPVANTLFGESVTVSGLLPGKDIARSLAATDLTDVQGIILPAAALRSGDDVFVDDYTLADLKKNFPHRKIFPVADGEDLYELLHDWDAYRPTSRAVYLWQRGTAYTVRER